MVPSTLWATPGREGRTQANSSTSNTPAGAGQGQNSAVKRQGKLPLVFHIKQYSLLLLLSKILNGCVKADV